MSWIIIGAAVGFFVGGTVGTVLAPQRAQRVLDGLPERFSAIRSSAQRAASEAEASVRRRSERPRRRRRRRSRRRRGRG